MNRTIIVTYPTPGDHQALRETKGKFLELELEGRDFLVFAPFELHRYHNQILAHFLQEHRISHRWIGEEQLEVDSPALVVSGGGRFHIDEGGGILELWDDSHVYGKFTIPGIREKIAGAEHPWSGYEVKLG